MAKNNLRDLLSRPDHVVVAPCVYDCASARAVELVGFEAAMLSGGELSIAMNGSIDYGFTSLTDTEWMVSRLAATSPLALAVDIEDGYGGPLAVYRGIKRLVRAGAQAVQLEDSAGMDSPTDLIARDLYYQKVRAALAALEGSDTILIARTNADPATQLDEGCERMAEAHRLGAHMTTVVKLNNLKDATYVAERVPGWKMYPDVAGRFGVPEVTVEQIAPLGFNFMTMHYTLKAAMDGMIEHGLANFAQQGSLYTCDKDDASTVHGCSALPLFDPQAYMELEGRFTQKVKEYTIVGNEVEAFPTQFHNSKIDDRL